MGFGRIRVGRLAGIPIGVQPLWLVIVALITLSLGAFYHPDRGQRQQRHGHQPGRDEELAGWHRREGDQTKTRGGPRGFR